MKTRPLFHALLLSAVLFASCERFNEKINLPGILVANTAVEDRVAMSYRYFLQHYDDKVWLTCKGDYSFLVGSDSHLTTDPGRMDEMLAIGLAHDDLFYAHLGDIADTKVEYYITLDSLLQAAEARYRAKHFTLGDKETVYPFFPVVGNHDITRNGWALWSNIFHSSFYEIDVTVLLDDGNVAFDHLIFLDSASGTLGATQIQLIEKGVLNGKHDDGTSKYRNTFVFSHTNIFKPKFNHFASTFTREEVFYLLDKFEEWNVTCVFCGHVHTWDERNFNGVHYLTLESMCEVNNPDPGDYLVRMDVHSDGSVKWSPVHMSYTAKRK